MKPLHILQRSLARCCVSSTIIRRTSSSSSSYLIDPAAERAKAANRNLENNKNKNSKKLRRARSQFIDRSRLHCRGGSGGRGSLSVNMGNRKHFWRPDGGHGGAGGSVVVVADPHCLNLQRSHPHVAARNGGAGGAQACHGAAAENRIVRVPPGVIVRRVLQHDEEWNEETQTVTALWERDELRDDVDEELFLNMTPNEAMDHSFHQMKQAIRDAGTVDSDDDYNQYDDDEQDENSIFQVERKLVTLADLDAPGAHIVVARGGAGGFGNVSYSSLHVPLPDGKILQERAKGRPGETVELELELKLIADVGLYVSHI